MNLKNKKIYIAGHKGMLGSAIYRQLKTVENKLGIKLLLRTRKQLDLINYKDVSIFFKRNKPDIVINCASLVGGIKANYENPANFYFINTQIQNNLIHHSHLNGVKFFCFIGSSCIYPRMCKQPIKEEYLLTDSLEKTNEAYAIAKIAGIKMLEYYNRQHRLKGVSVMPCNLYGPNDNYDLNNSHVIAAILRKVASAKNTNKKQIYLWGDGSAKREFMHVDDAARAIIHVIKKTKEYRLFNIGSGEEVTIKQLAKIVSKIAKYSGKIIWDTKYPNGTPRKILDISKLKKTGFRNKIDLHKGIKNIYELVRHTF